MISGLKIINFRSIFNDSIYFNSGINTIIGANGTGKTNLILALKFISSCVYDSPVRAVQKAGGLDKVFSIRDRRAQKCSFEISIIFNKQESDYFIENGSDAYETASYFFELVFDEVKKNFKISRESLVAKKRGSKNSEEIYNLHNTKGKIISSGLIMQDSDENSRRSDLSPEGKHLYIVHGRRYFTKKGQYDILLRSVHNNMAGITGYNLDPQMIRRSSDLLSNSDLAYDGRGFAALIYRTLKNKNAAIHDRYFSFRDVDGIELGRRLKDIYEDVLPFLHSFNSFEEMDSTTVDLRFTEAHQVKANKSFTADHLSDGTLKFLAIIFTIQLMPNNSLLFLEEIENYLNPKAIRRILELMRNHSESLGKTFILTSHSETVLNQMKASEIIVSRRIESGGTKYSQFKSLKVISSAIDESGTSLGTFWGKGGLDAF